MLGGRGEELLSSAELGEECSPFVQPWRIAMQYAKQYLVHYVFFIILT